MFVVFYFNYESFRTSPELFDGINSEEDIYKGAREPHENNFPGNIPTIPVAEYIWEENPPHPTDTKRAFLASII